MIATKPPPRLQTKAIFGLALLMAAGGLSTLTIGAVWIFSEAYTLSPGACALLLTLLAPLFVHGFLLTRSCPWQWTWTALAFGFTVVGVPFSMAALGSIF